MPDAACTTGGAKASAAGWGASRGSPGPRLERCHGPDSEDPPAIAVGHEATVHTGRDLNRLHPAAGLAAPAPRRLTYLAGSESDTATGAASPERLGQIAS